MKSFIFICVILISTLQISHQNEFAAKLIKAYFDKHQEVRKECLAQVNVDKDIEYNYEVNGDIAKDQNLGCFLKCIFLKEKVINEAGVMSLENLQKGAQLPNMEMVNGLMKKCSEFDKVDLCKGLVQFANCYVDYFQPILSQ